jgi:DNA polymerase-3 subunit epsilon
MEKILFIDLETTGLEYNTCAITQMAGIYEENGIEKERFNLKIRPNPEHAIYRGALDTTKVGYEDIMSYPLSQFEAYTKFLYMLDSYINKFDKKDKIWVVGYNIINFDAKFLRKFFEMHDNRYYNSYFYYPEIDLVPILSFYTMKTRNNIENFKLMSVAKGLNIEIDESKAHDALYDVEITREIFRVIINERDS